MSLFFQSLLSSPNFHPFPTSIQFLPSPQILLHPQVVTSPDLKKSGVYWSFSNTSGSFENQLSEEASDNEKGSRLWDVSMKLVGLA